jgi:hypothetical protein
MLIPHENGWSWNDGPVRRNKEDALADATVEVTDSGEMVYTVDTAELMEVDADYEP